MSHLKSSKKWQSWESSQNDWHLAGLALPIPIFNSSIHKKGREVNKKNQSTTLLIKMLIKRQ
jgi:hypothetical protein